MTTLVIFLAPLGMTTLVIFLAPLGMTTLVIPRSDATRDLLLAVPAPVHLSLAIPPRHLPTELRELLDAPRRTRMMRRDPARLRGEAVRDRHIELVERRHLAIEPRHRI